MNLMTGDFWQEISPEYESENSIQYQVEPEEERSYFYHDNNFLEPEYEPEYEPENEPEYEPEYETEYEDEILYEYTEEYNSNYRNPFLYDFDRRLEYENEPEEIYQVEPQEFEYTPEVSEFEYEQENVPDERLPFWDFAFLFESEPNYESEE